MRRTILVASVIIFVVRPAAALTVTDVGDDGASFADGEAAFATADSPDASNVADARGGWGGHGYGDIPNGPGDGGAAEASASTLVPGSAEAQASAAGGRGGSAAVGLVSGNPSSTGGAGGSALASAVAESGDGSEVLASASATGGAGGSGPAGAGMHGTGGAATALAIAVGAGTSVVQASASSEGGTGGGHLPFPDIEVGMKGRGGNAIAIATAQGLGEVVANASAMGGRSGAVLNGDTGSSGSAHATALGTGASGHVTADAITFGGELAPLHLTATASLGSTAAAEVIIDTSGPPRRILPGSRDAFAIAAHLPGNDRVEAAVQYSPNVAAAFANDEIDVVLSLGQIGFSGPAAGDDGAHSHSAKVQIQPQPNQVSVLQDVLLGFVSPTSIGSGFDSLHFRSSMGDTTLIDVIFDDPEAALAYFSDRVFDLGGFSISGVGPFVFVTSLTLDFEWTGSEPGSAFGVNWIIGLTPIPEPSTILLLALGLAVFAARQRRRRFVAI